MITLIGSFTPIDPQEASQIINDLNQTVNSLNESGALMQFILGNNFFICLLMFVPVVGPLFGFYTLFNTGTVISAVAIAGGYPSIVAFVTLFLTPVAWLEFAAYSIAIAESIWLFRRILKGRGVHELKNACLFVSISAVLLLLAAVIETALISIGA
jgi:uncharacterized membrane protein SpoIIM required for sporulation